MAANPRENGSKGRQERGAQGTRGPSLKITGDSHTSRRECFTTYGPSVPLNLAERDDRIREHVDLAERCLWCDYCERYGHGTDACPITDQAHYDRTYGA